MIKVGSKHLREMGFQVEKFLGARAAAAARRGSRARRAPRRECNQIGRRDAVNKCRGANCFFNKFILLKFAVNYKNLTIKTV